jgi:hypothetical protein
VLDGLQVELVMSAEVEGILKAKYHVAKCHVEKV